MQRDRVAVGGTRASRRVAAAVLAGLLWVGVGTACGERAGSDASDGLPDVVVVTLDTTRADHLGLYGYFRDTSPNLDALARESLVFERYVVPMATTLPSHVSLFTMTEPEEHGIIANIGAGKRAFVASEALVPFSRFAASLGMQTAAFVSAAPLKRKGGIDDGFAHFDEPKGAERRGDDVTDAALAWLAESADRAPFFLWVHYFDAHSPYVPPPGFRERFDDDDRLRAELAARGVPEQLPEDAGDAVEHASRYDGEIAFMDEQFGRLLDALRARRRWQRTLLIVAGDHGESLGQHQKLGHGEVWGEQLHAPLVIRVPGQPAKRVGRLVGTVDVFPTLLALAPLPGAGEWLAQASGRNVLDDAAYPADRAIVSRSTEKRRIRFGEAVQHALTTERWKYVRSDDGARALYDLGADPHEQTDVSARHPDVVAALDARLSEARARFRVREAREVPLDPQRVEELRALGYVDDDEDAGS